MATVTVRYRGLSGRRILPAKDLKKHGVDVPKDLVFEAKNGWSMKVGDMSPELEEILKAEGTFQISESKGATADVKVEATKSDDTGSTVKDETTGQTSTKS